ncbi:MAG: hypothetical protein LBK43_00565 [Treponema sp.]|jgi:hypothetical protein|nr:hypothetical protein [Treponema sp.]
MNMIRVAGLFLLGLLVQIPVAAQETSPGTSVPDALRRPQRGEAPRYPKDTVIGTLGRGAAAEEAYTLARAVLTALLRGNQDALVLQELDPQMILDYLTALEPIKPQKFRIGGGREEPDGSTSFLIRFVGREQWISGELYLNPEDTQWKVEELILEEPQDIQEKTETYPFDYSPYERLY